MQSNCSQAALLENSHTAQMLQNQSNTEYLSAIAAIISAATALLALIVGPILSLQVAKRQIGATTVSTERKEWISNLRNNIASFLAIISSVLMEQAWTQKLDRTQLKTKVDELLLLKAQISLLLDRDIESHIGFNQSLNDIVNVFIQYVKEPTDEKKLLIAEKMNNVGADGHRIISSEWKLLSK
jgi:hypothetical protein